MADPSDVPDPVSQDQTAASNATPQPHDDPEWAICPWCGHKHGDGWEWARERTVTRCDGCDNMFTVDPEYSVTFHTFVTGDENVRNCK